MSSPSDFDASLDPALGSASGNIIPEHNTTINRSIGGRDYNRATQSSSAAVCHGRAHNQSTVSSGAIEGDELSFDGYDTLNQPYARMAPMTSQTARDAGSVLGLNQSTTTTSQQAAS